MEESGIRFPAPVSLRLAFESERPGTLLRRLLKCGADPNELLPASDRRFDLDPSISSISPLCWAALRNRPDWMRSICFAGGRLTATETSFLLPHVTWLGVSEWVVELLLEYGCNVNASSPFFGARPLTGAAAVGNAKVVRALLRAGADVTLPHLDAAGDNPIPVLHLAAHNTDDVVRVLLQAGAGVDALDADRHSALDAALLSGRDLDIHPLETLWRAGCPCGQPVKLVHLARRFLRLDLAVEVLAAHGHLIPLVNDAELVEYARELMGHPVPEERGSPSTSVELQDIFCKRPRQARR